MRLCSRLSLGLSFLPRKALQAERFHDTDLPRNVAQFGEHLLLPHFPWFLHHHGGRLSRNDEAHFIKGNGPPSSPARTSACTPQSLNLFRPLSARLLLVTRGGRGVLPHVPQGETEPSTTVRPT